MKSNLLFCFLLLGCESKVVLNAREKSVTHNCIIHQSKYGSITFCLNNNQDELEICDGDGCLNVPVGRK